MDSNFKNKVVVIIGGSEGIGFATAKRFSEEGAKVYIAGRDKDKIDIAIREIGGSIVGIAADVCSKNDLDRFYQQIQEHERQIDVLFANAGISESAPLGMIEEEHFDRVFGINVKGLVFSVQKALPLMKTGSSIILTGSAAGSKGMAALSVYSATKAAVRSFARTWTTDLKGKGIRVNVVSPGTVRTPALQQYIDNNPGSEGALLQMTPLGRIGDGEEIADAVLFLASNQSRFITGVELFVDGGMMAV